MGKEHKQFFVLIIIIRRIKYELALFLLITPLVMVTPDIVWVIRFT